ncbi:hypothetical protein QAD02_020632 [Eretmocerus hayati]|uniref:Uncharacterized protein n=1 Tax=Eretmocerus hayati TaxID=131215 RepID=A0ACC2PNF3_9HYME|nr:hypothetical protein QAD02_020632 [Eretmocerus hayati]
MAVFQNLTAIKFHYSALFGATQGLWLRVYKILTYEPSMRNFQCREYYSINMCSCCKLLVADTLDIQVRLLSQEQPVQLPQAFGSPPPDFTGSVTLASANVPQYQQVPMVQAPSSRQPGSMRLATIGSLSQQQTQLPQGFSSAPQELRSGVTGTPVSVPKHPRMQGVQARSEHTVATASTTLQALQASTRVPSGFMRQITGTPSSVPHYQRVQKAQAHGERLITTTSAMLKQHPEQLMQVSSHAQPLFIARPVTATTSSVPHYQRIQRAQAHGERLITTASATLKQHPEQLTQVPSRAQPRFVARPVTATTSSVPQYSTRLVRAPGDERPGFRCPVGTRLVSSQYQPAHSPQAFSSALPGFTNQVNATPLSTPQYLGMQAVQARSERPGITASATSQVLEAPPSIRTGFTQEITGSPSSVSHYQQVQLVQTHTERLVATVSATSQQNPAQQLQRFSSAPTEPTHRATAIMSDVPHQYPHMQLLQACSEHPVSEASASSRQHLSQPLQAF